jgi:phosphatidylglycerol---prolipoprotein diacylglyceryl transferase
MFPTIAYLIQYVTGWNVALSIPTFGVLMAMSFWGAYVVFRSEFIRKESLGVIRPQMKYRLKGAPVSARVLLLSGVAVFIAGWKFIYICIHFTPDIRNIRALLLSSSGSILGGAVAALLMTSGILIYHRIYRLDPPRKFTYLEHPYQLMDKLLLYCGIIGFAGALFFGKLEDPEGLFRHPFHWLVTYNGLVYFGGLIFGALTYLVITYRNHIPLAVAADIGSPGMMLAYAIGRMGCHLSGDGDWGIANNSPKPVWLRWAPDWIWGFRYPHNVSHQGMYIPGCGDQYCTELVHPVFPTSFYESVICLCLFGILWFLRRRIQYPGMLFFIYALFSGIERFFIEFIRITPVFSIAGCQFTQAQYISLLLIAIGLAGITTFLLSARNKMLPDEHI